MFGSEYWRHVRFFRFSWSRGDISPESDSEPYEESDAVELADKVLLRFLRDPLWISVSPFIVTVGSSTDAVSEAVVDGRLCIDESGDGGDESLLMDNWVSEGVRGNNDDAFGLETDLRRRVL